MISIFVTHIINVQVNTQITHFTDVIGIGIMVIFSLDSGSCNIAPLVIEYAVGSNFTFKLEVITRTGLVHHI